MKLILPVKPKLQKHFTSLPFSIKHCPPFWQILFGHKDTEAADVVVEVVVVAGVTATGVSQNEP